MERGKNINNVKIFNKKHKYKNKFEKMTEL
jgi:hypothetical protein